MKQKCGITPRPLRHLVKDEDLVQVPFGIVNSAARGLGVVVIPDSREYETLVQFPGALSGQPP